MTLDITQFYQTFFDEADELLADMERHLLALDVDAPDSEQLNAIFRAAHSIKGGAATFGFNVLTETTHVFESVLDLARNHQLQLTTAMVDVFLEAKDVLVQLIDAHRASAEPDKALADAIAVRLRAIAEPEAAPRGAAPVTVAAAPLMDLDAELALLEPASDPAPADAPDDEDGSEDGSEDPRSAPTRVLRQLQVIAGVESADGDAPSPGVAGARSAGAVQAGAPEAGSAPAGAHLKIRLINVKADDRALLVEEVGNLGKIVHREENGETLSLWVDTDCAPDDIVAVCCFVIDEDQIEVSRAGSPGADAAAVAAEVIERAATPEPAPSTPSVAPTVPAETPAAHAAEHAASGSAVTPAVEHVRATARPAAAAAHASTEASSIRVGVEKVDQLINLVGELVITQAMLAQTAAGFDPVEHNRLFNGMAQLERNARDLQEAVMSIRMMPMDYVFSRFPRVVRDLASKLDKRVELVTFGQATELDKSLIERIIDPLTHLVRNSLDHGIETPERRIAAGKDPVGQLVLSAEHQGGNIVIEVSDDGAGLNRERIVSKALKQGLIASGDSMSDDEVWQLIFLPGFSTAEQVTDVSGRGVGMDVVRRNIQSMGGHVEIQSRPAQGSTIRIVLPLTLAILDGMSVRVGGETFIVPLSAVMESLQPAQTDIYTIAGGDTVLRVRGEYLPIVALHETFGVENARTDPTQAISIILQAEGRRFALLVDELVGQHQVVVKNLETNYRKVPGISAATILGDGSVALIVDVPALNRSRGQ